MNEPLAEATLTDVINATIRLSAATERLERGTAGQPTGHSSVRITFSAGSIAVMFACGVSLFMAGMMLIGGMWMVSMSARYEQEFANGKSKDDVQDAYIQTYIQQLQPAKEPEP